MPERVARVDDFDDFEEDGRPSRARLVLAWFLRRPVDSIAGLIAAGGVCTILINALFLQSGPHPAPIFANKPPPAPAPVSHSLTAADTAVPRARPADLVAVPLPPEQPRPRTQTEAPREAKPAPATRKNDPIANLLAAEPKGDSKLMAVQRALSAYGYGQIKPTGVYDTETRMAIEQFERDRRMPVTGRMSERMIRELSSLIGRPLE